MKTRNAICKICLILIVVMSRPCWGRTKEQIGVEMVINMAKVFQMLGEGNATAGSNPFTLTSGRIFKTAQSRRAAGASMIPVINRALDVYAEFEPLASPTEQEAYGQTMTFFAILDVALGDAKRAAALKKTAGGAGAEAAMAQSILAAADYLAAGQEPHGQAAAIDRLQKAYQNVNPEAPLRDVPMIFSKNPPAREVVDQLFAFLRADTHSRLAKGIADGIQRPMTVAALLNQPLTINSTLMDGSQFSTAMWKEKVVLVNIWSVTCAPCLEEMDVLKRFYPNLHAKGLEVVNYSCDDSPEPVAAYLAKNPGILWPQIFDVAHPGWEAVQKSFGVESAPTTFLIDRKGILRSMHVGLNKNLAVEIAKLLAEVP